MPKTKRKYLPQKLKIKQNKTKQTVKFALIVMWPCPTTHSGKAWKQVINPSVLVCAPALQDQD